MVRVRRREGAGRRAPAAVEATQRPRRPVRRHGVADPVTAFSGHKPGISNWHASGHFQAPDFDQTLFFCYFSKSRSFVVDAPKSPRPQCPHTGGTSKTQVNSNFRAFLNKRKRYGLKKRERPARSCLGNPEGHILKGTPIPSRVPLTLVRELLSVACCTQEESVPSFCTPDHGTPSP